MSCAGIQGLYEGMLIGVGVAAILYSSQNQVDSIHTLKILKHL